MKRAAPNLTPIGEYRNREPIMLFVEEERRRQGVSQTVLAARAGVSCSAIRNCLGLGHSPTLVTVTSLLGALGYRLAAVPLDERPENETGAAILDHDARPPRTPGDAERRRMKCLPLVTDTVNRPDM